MSQAILSVVRHKDDPDLSGALDRYNDAYLKSLNADQIAKLQAEREKYYLLLRGNYVKSGGGYTTNLQEAQIFGWSRKAKENLAGYNPKMYDIIPILLTPAV